MSNRLHNSNNPTSQNFTIANIADELGISKSTVSRVLSGKGRISEETRQRVLTCAKEHNYTPNLMAKGLATSKSFNVGVIIPKNASQNDMSFFHNSLTGITEQLSNFNYNVLLSVTNGNSIEHLERITRNNKIDGVILTSLLQDDKRVSFLENCNLPFVVIGLSEKEIIQIDSDNQSACFNFTKELIKQGLNSFAFICGDSNIVVNNARKMGFINAVKEMNLPESNYKIFLDITNSDQVKECIESISNKYNCIICSDDNLCSLAIAVLKEKNLKVPEEFKLASFYDSPLLEQHTPSISAISINAYKLGSTAASVLCKKIQDEAVELKNYVPYDFKFRESTKNE